MIKLMLKIIIVFILLIPAFLLTLIIFILGGWTQGWDYMPNPVDSLFDFIDK